MPAPLGSHRTVHSVDFSGEPAYPAAPGRAGRGWWIVNDEAVASEFLSSRRKLGLELVKVLAGGQDTGTIFAVVGDSWWVAGQDDFGSLRAAFGVQRVRTINQEQWDLIRTRLDQLASVPV